jgi:hypothetical protein
MKKDRNNPASVFSLPRQVKIIGIIFIVLFLAVLSQGCAPSLVSIDRNELAQLKDQPLINVVHYSPPKLVAKTPSTGIGSALGAVGGIVGGVAGGVVAAEISKTQGEKLKQQCSLEDPSIRVREKVINSCSAQMAIKNFNVVQEPLDSDEMDALRSKLGNDLVMDFKTNYWMILPTALSQWTMTRQYYVMHSTRARLIRLQDSKVMWLGSCDFDGKKTLSTSSTWDELIANGCSQLKANFSQAAEMCAQQLLDQLFGKVIKEK